MPGKTVVSQAVLHSIKKNKPSALTTRRIRVAIEDINTSTVDALCKSGKVKKMNLPKDNNFYIYRAGLRERVIFSAHGNNKIIQNIVTADELMNMRNG